MNSRKREMILMGLGILTGIALSGPAAQAAASLTATPSTQAIYLNGLQIQMEAYAIHGNNFVKLRDVGQAVGFNVYWDGQAVQIESGKPYTGTGPAAQAGTGAGHLANGKPVTEENVMELLREIERKYPAQSVWGGLDTPGTLKNETPSAVSGALMAGYHVNQIYGCSGYAAMVSSLVFGDQGNPCRRVTDLSQIRPGDIVFRVRNRDNAVRHVEIALESPDALRSFQSTDGNHNGAVWWPDEQSRYSKTALDCFGPGEACRLEVWTRYPESVPFTGANAGAWITEYSN